MNKNIINLNIPEENKILLSKIEKRIYLLSDQSQLYFENIMMVSSENIENAYSNNEDLLKILKKNDDKIYEIKKESYSIREKHQTNFTAEIPLDSGEKEEEPISIIKNTLDNRMNLVDADQKMLVLNKRIRFLNKKKKFRKEEMQTAFKNIQEKINEVKSVDIKPIKEDIKLIKHYINPKEIKNTKLYFLIPIILFIASIITMGVAIWALL